MAFAIEKELVCVVGLYSPKYSSWTNFPSFMTKNEAVLVDFKFSTMFFGKEVLLYKESFCQGCATPFSIFLDGKSTPSSMVALVSPLR